MYFPAYLEIFQTSIIDFYFSCDGQNTYFVLLLILVNLRGTLWPSVGGLSVEVPGPLRGGRPLCWGEGSPNVGWVKLTALLKSVSYRLCTCFTSRGLGNTLVFEFVLINNTPAAAPDLSLPVPGDLWSRAGRWI